MIMMKRLVKIEGVWYEIDSIPKNLIKELVEVNGVEYDVNSLPNNLIIEGSLSLKNSYHLIRLPDNLTVEGDLILSNCNSLKSLPRGLKVGNCLYLNGCNSLECIPSDLTVKESLDLSDCTALEFIQEDLKIECNLNLTNCPISYLPENLTIKNSLDLSNCTSLKCLPENLIVKGNLQLYGCVFKSLPLTLKVGEFIRVNRDFPVKDYPMFKFRLALSWENDTITKNEKYKVAGEKLISIYTDLEIHRTGNKSREIDKSHNDGHFRMSTSELETIIGESLDYIFIEKLSSFLVIKGFFLLNDLPDSWAMVSKSDISNFVYIGLSAEHKEKYSSCVKEIITNVLAQK